MKIIGLDVGEKRIGVARVDSNTRIAVSVGYVLADGSEWQEIARIAALQGANCFVIGLPRSNEGNETAQSLYVRQFAKTLAEKLPGAKIRFQDESLTSVEAEERLKKRKKKSYDKGEIDAEAAAIILQDFVEGLTGVATASTPVSSEIAGAEKVTTKTMPGEQTGVVKETPKKAAEVAKRKNRPRRAKKGFIVAIPIIIIAVVAGVIGAVKWREQQLKEREEEFARQEAAMVAEVFNFTILPGETIYDVQNKLMRQGYSQTEVEEAFNAEYDFKFLKERPTGATLEGYLYGETYEFYATASVEEILTKFLTGMQQVITAYDLESRYTAQGLTLHEGVTLASVVQKEASAAEQPGVAQVFYARLASGVPLGSDVTVTYALDTVDPWRIAYADNEAALTVDSCYNTRLYAGLPCGPISNPALSALLAVAEPADTEYFYFLTGDDGLMYYSYTETEHLQNAALYCAELCQVSL